MPPTPAWRMRALTSSVPSFSSAPTMASTDPCTSPLISSGNSLRPGGLELAHHLLERAARGTARRLLAPLTRAIIGDLARARLAVHDREPIARFRRAGEAEHLDRHRGTRLRNVLSLIVDQRPHASPFAAGDHDVAHAQGPALHQNGGDRAAAAVEFRLDHRAFRRAVGIGLEIEHFGLQPDRFQQLAEIGFLRGRNLDVERLAAHRSRPALRAAAVRCARARAWRRLCRSC